jgi:hypothetical protein
VSNEPIATALAEFVKAVADTISAATQGIHASRIVSDYELLRLAAQETLAVHPLSPKLLVELLGEGTSEVKAELALLLLSLYNADDAYLSERTQHGPRYRFEENYPKGAPEWVLSGLPHEYVRSLVVEVAVQQLLASGAWERPARLRRRPPSD